MKTEGNEDEVSLIQSENAALKATIVSINAKLVESEKLRDVLSAQNDKLRSDLSTAMSKGKSLEYIDQSCQTNFDLMTDVNDVSEKDNSNNSEALDEPEIMTAESIASTAQSALANSGWVYDKSTGTYFDYNTKLYYYPKTHLYYNYMNGCYYNYNRETQQYEFQFQHEMFQESRQGNYRQKGSSSMNEVGKTFCLDSNANEFDTKTKESKHKLDDICSMEKVKFSENLDEHLKLTDLKRGEATIHERRSRMFIGRGGKSHLDESDSENRGRLIDLYMEETLSDSETGCRKINHKRLLICRMCFSIVRIRCRSGMDSKKKQGESTKHLAIKMHGKEENTANFSDSELETLSIPRQRFLQCEECLHSVNTACCQERKYARDWMDDSRFRKRRNLCDKEEEVHAKRSKTDTEFEVLNRGPISYNDLAITNDLTLSNVSDLDADSNPIPCIRAMVTSSESVEVGTLFIVTCVGARIGSSDRCDIRLDEVNVSVEHAKITYLQQQKHYFVTDLGSDTGTKLNAEENCLPGQEYVFPSPVMHKSILCVGSTVMVLHLHKGYDTCDDCEPGQIRAMLGNKQEAVKILTKKEKEEQRRSELKSLRKKFNLHKDKYQQNVPQVGPQYTDRAAERRRTKGSDNPYEKDEIPTSLDMELASHNKGHQMMQKMGWEKGKGLGKTADGITEPLKPQGTGKGKCGLGFGRNPV